jgi:hypothetical protein
MLLLALDLVVGGPVLRVRRPGRNLAGVDGGRSPAVVALLHKPRGGDVFARLAAKRVVVALARDASGVTRYLPLRVWLGTDYAPSAKTSLLWAAISRAFSSRKSISCPILRVVQVRLALCLSGQALNRSVVSRRQSALKATALPEPHSRFFRRSVLTGAAEL